MNFVSKRYSIKVPSEINIIYCQFKNVLLFKSRTKTKILFLNVKLLILEEKNIILVTNKFSNDLGNKQIKKCSKNIQGITISLIKQALVDVQNITHRKLKLVGVGFKVFEEKIKYTNKILQFKLGYSHSLYYKIPNDIIVNTHQSTSIFLSGSDLVKLSLNASLIRNFKKPEPYKGKGIVYSDEVIKLKEGKKV